MSASTDVTLAWMQRARSDLQLGRAALDTKGVLPEDAAFHAQQCAEKALKALLLHREVAFPKTHAIEVLLDLLKMQGLNIPKGVDEWFWHGRQQMEIMMPASRPMVSRPRPGRPPHKRLPSS